jgi:hypothetical protein
MKRTLLASAVAALALTAGRADAQYGYFPPVYANPYQQQVSYAPQLPYQGGGYAPQFQPGYGGPASPDVQFVSSLYAQYLGRNPDPKGLNTWVNRLAQFGGDTNRLTQEFIQASQRELNSNNPYYPRGGRGRWR